jgi:hypothetical protein
MRKMRRSEDRGLVRCRKEGGSGSFVGCGFRIVVCWMKDNYMLNYYWRDDGVEPAV